LFRRTRSLLLVSHTNTAVDEALVQIADALGPDYKEGEIARVGEPALERLRQRPQLLLKKLAEKRSDELRAQKERIESERRAGISELARLERAIAVSEWVVEGEPDIATMNTELLDINRLDSQASQAQATIRETPEDTEHWQMARRAAEAALNQKQNWLESQLEGLHDAYSVPASQLLADAGAFFQRLAELRLALKSLDQERFGKRGTLETNLSDLLEVLGHLNLASDEAGAAESMLNAVKEAHLKAVEEQIIADARILATTFDANVSARLDSEPAF
jgi:hypothetical protein